jgi:hypothetical protein
VSRQRENIRPRKALSSTMSTATLYRRRSLTSVLNKGARTAIALVMGSCIIAHAEEVDSWQRAPSDGQFRSLSNLPAVPKADIYEVVPTKFETALAWHLAKVPFAVLTCTDADFLAGGHYKCDPSKKPVLVRAVFANGGTGAFEARYDAGTLYILHGSLGDPGPTKNVALIINLPFAPIEVYSWASFAK